MNHPFKIAMQVIKTLSAFMLLGLFNTTLAAATPDKNGMLHEERSLYTRILVHQNKDLRCLKFTLVRSDSNQSCIDLSQPKRMVFTYARMTMTALLFNPTPKRILIVGLGGGTLPMALGELIPDAIIDTVEIDPAVIQVARDYFDYRSDSRNRIFTEDARVFGKRAQIRGERYELIILDAFNGEYIPEHLMTIEYLSEMRALLTENGVLVANTFSTSNLYHHESNSYREVFGSFLNYRRKDTGNRVILIPEAKKPTAERTRPTKSDLEERARQLETALEPYGVDIVGLSKDVAALYNKKPDWNPRKRPLSDQYSPANLLRKR